jgi:hypothetical protein
LELPESAFIEQTGGSANPLWGSCGDFESAWGGANDYGVYLEALVPTRYECGFMADVFYGGNASSLTTRIDAGMAVMTSLGYFGESAEVQEDKGTYPLAPGLHVVTVFGYDDGVPMFPTRSAVVSPTTTVVISSAPGFTYTLPKVTLESRHASFRLPARAASARRRLSCAPHASSPVEPPAGYCC